jgi:beta-carotene 3-hydroxylase
VLVAIVAFAAMEPVTALTHRLVMHGFGWGWHRSHHQRPGSARWEANDLFPIVFAVIAMALFALGQVAMGIGITAYGACYAAVHELAIHHRVGHVPTPRLLAEAHAEHHRTGRAPYGMLLPVRPRTATAALRQVGTRARADHTS